MVKNVFLSKVRSLLEHSCVILISFNIFAVQLHYSTVHVPQLLNASSGCRSQFLSLFLHLLCRTAIGSIYSLIVLFRLCAHFRTHLWPLMPFLTQLWPKYVMHKYQCIIHTYRIVASTNTCYYSENQVFGGVTIQVLCSKRGCY